jgi:hypothetical protein
MRILFTLTGLLALGIIFWAVLGYLMDLPSFSVSFPLCIIFIGMFFLAGVLKNREERRKFREFLESRKRDNALQERLKDERIEPGDKTGRTKVKTYFRDRNVGVNWTGASVHGAVPHRKKRRTFLPKNR